MNRLVIIGNGFDLAHGLKTTYKDFFTWLWVNQIKNVNYDEVIEPGKVHFSPSPKIPPKRKANTYKHTVNTDLFTISFSTSNSINFSYIKENITQHWQTKITLYNTDYELLYDSNNSFFKHLLQKRNITNQWADIEKLFFTLLVDESETHSHNVSRLNKDFEYIKKLFEEYLLTIDTQNIQRIDTVHREFFYREERLINHGIGNENASLLILNFNYTNTPIEYIGLNDADDEKILSIDTEINQIHGELNNTDNPIIFGYGDERGEEYKKIELLDNNTFFEHIKSFAYLNTPNYTDLVKFLDADNFDTITIGHSCGLTDRTLLNTIFEHKNCISIKPLYYKYSSGGDNYQDIVRNISRNIDDKVRMRNLIVNKTETISTN